MERDAVLAHGIGRFIRERFLDTADGFITYVCDNKECGMFAQRLVRRGDERKTTIQIRKGMGNDIYVCPVCKDNSTVSKIKIPYAFKLAVQEMMSMSIAPRIMTKKSAL
jgi:DNA-directed RNA polymerase II subunit RPB2